MNSATHTVKLVKGSESAIFFMREWDTSVDFRNSRGEMGTISREAAQADIAAHLSSGYRPSR